MKFAHKLMELDTIILSEISQNQRDRIIHYFLYVNAQFEYLDVYCSADSIT